MTLRDALEYEIRGSWWAELIWFEWGQALSASYFAWKVRRKFSRYEASKRERERLLREYLAKQPTEG